MSDYRDNLGDLRSMKKVYERVRDEEENVVVQESDRLTRMIWTYRGIQKKRNNFFTIDRVKMILAEVIMYSTSTLDEFCKNRRKFPQEARIKLHEYLSKNKLLYLVDNPYTDREDKIKTIDKSRKKRLRRGEKSDHPFFYESPRLSETESVELDEFWADNYVCTEDDIIEESNRD